MAARINCSTTFQVAAGANSARSRRRARRSRGAGSHEPTPETISFDLSYRSTKVARRLRCCAGGGIRTRTVQVLSLISLRWSTPAPVPSAPCLRQRVAVGTQNTEVFDAIVAGIAVHVVERERQRLASPGIESALLAAALLQPCTDQARPEPCAVQVPRVRDENLGQRNRLEPESRLLSPRPPLAEEVISVDFQPPDVATDETMHPTTGLIAEPALDFGKRHTRTHSIPKIIVRPGAGPTDAPVDDEREVTGIDSKPCDIATQRRVSATTGPQSQSRANPRHGLAICYGRPQLILRPTGVPRHASVYHTHVRIRGGTGTSGRRLQSIS